MEVNGKNGSHGQVLTMGDGYVAGVSFYSDF